MCGCGFSEVYFCLLTPSLAVCRCCSSVPQLSISGVSLMTMLWLTDCSHFAPTHDIQYIHASNSGMGELSGFCGWYFRENSPGWKACNNSYNTTKLRQPKQLSAEPLNSIIQGQTWRRKPMDRNTAYEHIVNTALEKHLWKKRPRK